MNLLAVVYRALRELTPARRSLARWRRRSEAEATIAAERIETARLLAGIASCQLRLAELDQGGPGAHPHLQRYHDELQAALTRVYRAELYRYWEQTEVEQ
jgi:hypothetical protein